MARVFYLQANTKTGRCTAILAPDPIRIFRPAFMDDDFSDGTNVCELGY